jgi:hypothetical protein
MLLCLAPTIGRNRPPLEPRVTSGNENGRKRSATCGGIGTVRNARFCEASGEVFQEEVSDGQHPGFRRTDDIADLSSRDGHFKSGAPCTLIDSVPKAHTWQPDGALASGVRCCGCVIYDFPPEDAKLEIFMGAKCKSRMT